MSAASSEALPALAPAATPPIPRSAAAPKPMAKIVPTPGTNKLATALPIANPALVPIAPTVTLGVVGRKAIQLGPAYLTAKTIDSGEMRVASSPWTAFSAAARELKIPRMPCIHSP